ncbi:UNVERIFIED_CONTAM: hypothetical protein PYX00_005772 [Menopon gallinae]|uniref:Uncharacterized protein n=1 Tax=Menopon gallinae TaxID=328185 RepID=A0AAW2HSR3_9NEOP
MKNHRDFSNVYRIIIQPVAEDIGFDVASVRQSNGKIQNVLTSLQQQLRESVRDEVTKTEERIRAFSEEQYMRLEEFRNRATKDQKALARKIYEVQVPFESQDIALSSNTQDESRRVDNIDTSINRRLLTPKKSGPVSAAIRQENEFKGRQILARSVSSYSRVQEKVAGSLDSEGLFVIEGMEDNVTNEPGHSEGESDTDHEDSGSHDEGIDVHRKLAPSFQLAQSLPVNVPVYSITPSDFGHDDGLGKEYEESVVKCEERSGFAVFSDYLFFNRK